jgi:hypothetical protein
MMATAGIEDLNGDTSRRHGSIHSHSSQRVNSGGGEPSDGMNQSRRCSRHSNMSKRSSLASNGNNAAAITTKAEVLMSVSPRHQQTIIASGNLDLERRLSQMSDVDVDMVMNVATGEALSRRSSVRGSFRRPLPSSSMGAMVSAATAMSGVPSSSPGSGGGGILLAPPTEAEQMAQRRFSEVNAATERHNSRRQVKRAQSVMHKNKRRPARRGSEIRRSSPGAPGSEVFDPYNRMPAGSAAPGMN